MGETPFGGGNENIDKMDKNGVYLDPKTKTK